MNNTSELLKWLTEPPSNDGAGWTVLVALWITILFSIGLTIYGVLSAINYMFLPIKNGYGVVYEMHFEPAHYSTTMVYNAATKSILPITHWHPDAWKLVIEKDGLKADYYVAQGEYIKYDTGKWVYIKYKNGRLWGSLIIKEALLQSL
jgi:hypothetical protein